MSSRESVQGSVLAVRSPIAGRVIDLGAAAGEYWNDTNAPLLTVANLATVFITASADKTALKSIFVGQPAQVVLDAYPGDTLHGQVRDVGDVRCCRRPKIEPLPRVIPTQN